MDFENQFGKEKRRGDVALPFRPFVSVLCCLVRSQRIY